MFQSLGRKKYSLPFRIGAFFVILAFSANLIILPQKAYAQSVLNLPVPGAMITTTPGFTPPLIKGLKIYPEQPFRFDFIIDIGKNSLEGKALEDESTKLVKYFLASLTTPEDELWVNLSPYEKDRIISKDFGETEMGRDLLSQDYILKQLTASLLYPEEELGSQFWEKVYQKAAEKYGTTEIPINTFNKVWIVPDDPIIYQNGDQAYVVESKLKVMLEEDYLALKNNLNEGEIGTDQLEQKDVEQLSSLSSSVVKEVILPAIEKEVNEGKNFAQLRQIQNSLVLAVWYKKTLKESLLAGVYVDKNKTKGVDVEDKQVKEKIYQQYLEAFKKGVYDYIKEDYDKASRQIIPRKYFSGGYTTKSERGNLQERTTIALSLDQIPNTARDDFQEYVESAREGDSNIVNVSVAFSRIEQERFNQAGEFGKYIDLMVGELEDGGIQVVRTDKGYDLKGLFRDKPHGEVIKHSHGKMWMEEDGILVIIDDRFERDHVGRGGYQFAVYARTVQKVLEHELPEARKLLEDARELNILSSSDDIDMYSERIRGYTNRWGSPRISEDELLGRRNQVVDMLNSAHLLGLLLEGREDEFQPFPHLSLEQSREVEDFDFIVASDNSKPRASKNFGKKTLLASILAGIGIFISGDGNIDLYRHHQQAFVPSVEVSGRIISGTETIGTYGLFTITLNPGEKYKFFKLKDEPIYHIEFDSLDTQNRALNRLGIFVEDGNYHGKVLTDIEMSKYFQGDEVFGVGHDYQASDIARFYNEVKRNGIILNETEEALRQKFLGLGLIEYSNGSYHATNNIAIISTAQDVENRYQISGYRDEVISHELDHARWFTDSTKRSRVAALFDSLSPDLQKIVTDILVSRGGYNAEDQDLILREFSAFWRNVDQEVFRGDRRLRSLHALEAAFYEIQRKLRAIETDRILIKSVEGFLRNHFDKKEGDGEETSKRDTTTLNTKTVNDKTDQVSGDIRSEAIEGELTKTFVVNTPSTIKALSSLITNRGWEIKIITDDERDDLELPFIPHGGAIAIPYSGVGIRTGEKGVIYYIGEIRSAGHLSHETTHVLQALMSSNDLLQAYSTFIKGLGDSKETKEWLNSIIEHYTSDYNQDFMEHIDNNANLTDEDKQKEKKAYAVNEIFALIFGIAVGIGEEDKPIASCQLNPKLIKSLVGELKSHPKAVDFLVKYYITLGHDKVFVNEIFTHAFGQFDTKSEDHSMLGLDDFFQGLTNLSNRKISQDDQGQVRFLDPYDDSLFAKDFSSGSTTDSFFADLGDADFNPIVKRAQDQSQITDDVVLSSSGTLMDHEAYNEKVVGKDGEILKSIAEEIGAERLPNGDYDFRRAISVIKRSTDPQAPSVKKDNMGNTIITLEANKRYLMLTSRLDPITNQPELIIIDERFGADHAGRTRNQVYAQNFIKALHELMELRSWKFVEGDLIKKGEIDPEGFDGKPTNIREWTRANIITALAMDRLFHKQGLDMEKAFKGNEGNPGAERIISSNLLVAPMRAMENFNFDPWANFSIKEALKEFSSEPVSIDRMLELFEGKGAALKVRLDIAPTERPSVEELRRIREVASNNVDYEISIFQQRSTGAWFAVKGSETKVGSRLKEVLMLYDDISYQYHTHPDFLGQASRINPPSGQDLIVQGQYGDSTVGAVGDRNNVYVYSTNGIELDDHYTISLKLMKLESEVRRLSANKDKDPDDSYFQKWKEYLESLGFTIERYSWKYFVEHEDEIYDKLRNNLPKQEIIQEDIIITSDEKRKDNKAAVSIPFKEGDWLIDMNDSSRRLARLERVSEFSKDDWWLFVVYAHRDDTGRIIEEERVKFSLDEAKQRFDKAEAGLEIEVTGIKRYSMNSVYGYRRGMYVRDDNHPEWGIGFVMVADYGPVSIKYKNKEDIKTYSET